MLGKKGKSEDSSTKKNWYADRYQSVVVQRNVLSVFSLVAMFFSFIAIFLVYRNIPIVTVEPFVIQIEPKSGITQVVKQQSLVELTGQEALNNYFLVTFVRAYETVDSNIRNNFNVVRVMSDSQNVFRPYAWTVNTNNPESLLANPALSRNIEINSITKLDKNTDCVEKTCSAQLRVTRTTNERGQVKASESLLVYLEYTYTNVELTADERFLNPLGFRVTLYRVDKEIAR